jgi:hypothetical protein
MFCSYIYLNLASRRGFVSTCQEKNLCIEVHLLKRWLIGAKCPTFIAFKLATASA